MSDILLLPNGSTVDLNDRLGQYQYLSCFLVEKGAKGNLFSCLEKLYDIEKLKAENKKMREALKKIREESFNGTSDEYIAIYKIAKWSKNALDEIEGGK